jgi:hypothetical protein
MGKIIELKAFIEKQKRDDETAHFIEQLGSVETLYLQGDIDKVVIICTGKDLKCCTSNSVPIGEAKNMVRDFALNTNDYID